MSTLRWGVTVYGVFLAVWLFGLELPSKDVLGWAPWPSTTLTIRDAIKWWHPIALMVVVFLFMLYTHFDRDWPVRYLIVTAALIIAAVTLHDLSK